MLSASPESSSGPPAAFSDQAARWRLRSQKMQARVSGGCCTTLLSVRSAPSCSTVRSTVPRQPTARS
jgi:hypothetical protein